MSADSGAKVRVQGKSCRCEYVRMVQRTEVFEVFVVYGYHFMLHFLPTDYTDLADSSRERGITLSGAWPVRE